MVDHVCQLLNIKYPIIQGGMGNISNAQLTSAISEAGGLGTIGCGTMTPDEVVAIINETKSKTDRPFAMNIAINVSPYTNKLLELAVEKKVPIVTLSAGNPTKYISFLHDNGIKVLVVVASVKHAKKAEMAGADIIVAEGFEAAGINSNLELTTMTLIPQIVDNVNVPVIAAGGIADGRGLAASLMLGADGVQMGTRFIATKEAPFHTNYKNAILNATDTSAHIIGRSVGQIRRVLESDYTNEIKRQEATGISLKAFSQLTTEEQHVKGALKGNCSEGFMNGGLIAGLIQTIPSVREVIEGMMGDAEKRMERVYLTLQNKNRK